MIAEQYINEGIRIRKTYIHNLKEIMKQEPEIMSRKKVFEELQQEMESIVHSEMNEIRKTLELNNKLMILEREIKIIQDLVRPHHEAIENLRKDQDRLYLAIKEKYPGITPAEIERDIMGRAEE
jgi:hypothetical protein